MAASLSRVPKRRSCAASFRIRLVPLRRETSEGIAQMSLRYLRLALSAVVAFAASLPTAQADDYPKKPVTFITPAAAGNGPDVMIRMVADQLSRIWGQQIVVLNRPGAGGMLAAQAAAEAEKDGYTLFVGTSSTFTVLPIMQEGKMTVDLQNAFVPISLVGEQPMAMALNKEVPANTVPELIAYIKSNPDGILFAGTNRGSTSHLTGELFRERASVKMTFVHAQGASSSVTDVSAGRIPMMFDGLPSLSGGVERGGMKMIAVASDKRLPNFPNLPTIQETVPGVKASGWTALFAPTGTPKEIIDKVNADLAKVDVLPEVVERLQAIGTYTRPLTPEQTAQFVRDEEALWWPIVRRINNDTVTAAR
jgi:tripartite-type tricarboxylate transporter receptor subunit TctC